MAEEPQTNLSQQLAPAVKEIASGQWTKAVPLLAVVVTGIVTGNPLLGASAGGLTQIGLEKLLAKSATKRLQAAELHYEEERRQAVEAHLVEALRALQAADLNSLGISIQAELREEGEAREEAFLQLVRLLDRGFSGASAQARELQEYQAKRFDRLEELLSMQANRAAAPADALDADIGEAREALNIADLDTARVLLRRLRDRKWANLAPAARARVLTLQADCELRAGRVDASAELMIQAVNLTPEDESALVNVAFAYLMLGRGEEAVASASRAVALFPASGAAWGARLTCATGDTFEQELAALPAALRQDADVAVVVAVRSDLLPDAQASEVVELAASVAPEDPRAWNALGEFLLRSQLSRMTLSERKPPDARLIVRAESALTTALEKAKARGDAINSVNALLLRASARRFLANETGAVADVDVAAQLLPHDPRVVASVARSLAVRGRQDEAIQRVREGLVQNATDPQLRFLLTTLLWERNLVNDRQEAAEIARVEALASTPFVTPLLQIAVEGFLTANRAPEAKAIVDAASVDDVLRGALLARAALAVGDEEGAHKEVQAGLAAFGPTAQLDSAFALAKVLGRLGRHAEAMDLWSKLAETGDPQSVKNLVDCAVRLRRYGIAVQKCRELRLAGQSDDTLLSWELWILKQFDPEAALALLSELGELDPTNKGLAVELAVLAFSLGKQDVARACLPRLPTVAEADAAHGADVVRLLLGLGAAQAAADYAYDLLRRHFGSGPVHLLFVHATLLSDRAARDEPRVIEVVRPGSAVGFKEEGSAEEQWVVLEDSTVQRGPDVPGELEAGSALAAPFWGKRVGEQVVLAEGPGQNRLAVVTQIVDKVTHRVQDVFRRYQLRFKEPGLWQFRLGDGDGPEQFAPLIKIFEERAELTRRADDLYKEGRLTLHVLGQAIGADAVAAQLHVLDRPELKLRACLGDRGEYEEAAGALAVSGGVVLDASALVTLAQLRELDIALELGKKIIVSQSTLQLFRDAKAVGLNGAAGVQEDSSALLLPPPFLQIDRSEVVTWIEAHAEVTGCLALADLDPPVREQHTNAIGQAALESGLLAATGSRVLWSDDGYASYAARPLTGAKAVWSRLVFSVLAEAGKLSERRHTDALVRLIGWGYTFTPASPQVFRRAGELSAWRVEQRPLREAIDYLADPRIPDADASFLAVSLIVAAFGSALLLNLRETNLVAAFEALLRRPSGQACVEQAARLLPQSFGVNAIGLRGAMRAFEVWRRGTRPLL